MISIRYTRIVILFLLVFPARATSQSGSSGATSSQSTFSQPSSPTDSFKLTANEVASGLNKPVLAAFPPGGTLKFLVLESEGKIFWVDKETKSTSLLYNLSQNSKTVRIVDVLFHPEYEKNGRLFIAYIDTLNESVEYVVREFSSDEKSGLSAYKEIVRIKPTGKQEKSFSLALDLTGNLLIALPDGAENFDPLEQAQNSDLLWGKVLRYEIKQADYIAPLDNPFVMQKAGKNEIFALGFREPADMFFDTKDNVIWVSDRGADTFQELNILKSGANYGWSKFEGSQCLRMRLECSGSKGEMPIFEYPFKQGKKIAISPVYRGKKYSELEGFLFVHDALSGITWAIRKSADGKLEKMSVFLSDMNLRFDNFTSDGVGEIYAVSAAQGAVFKLELNSPAN